MVDFQNNCKHICMNVIIECSVLLIVGTHNKQGSKDAHVRIVVLLILSLIKSHKYSGAVLLTALCVKSKILKIILS